jgi:DNA invertase Pin-like site-specific DNA recombinase
MPNIIGYLRPDIDGQNIPSQLDQLKAAGAIKIVQEKPAGTKRNRSQLDKLLADARVGDTVMVTSLDRIAHNTRHLLEVVESLNAVGAIFKVIDNGIDTSTPQGEVIRLLLGAITDFERQVVRERQAMGIARAKQAGRYKGRKPTAMAKTDEVLALNAQGLTRQKIADQLDKPKSVERKPTGEPDTEQLSFF